MNLIQKGGHINLLTGSIKQRINGNIIRNIKAGDYTVISGETKKILTQLYRVIPDNKRISYGIYHIVKVLSEYIYHACKSENIDAFEAGKQFFLQSMELKTRGVALGILSFCGIEDQVIEDQQKGEEQENFLPVFPLFKIAAGSPDWIVREFAQGFFRKIIKKHPDKCKKYLFSCANSKDPLIRRFAAETLRPVQENRWFYKNPEYPLSILRCLFIEKEPYPRTAVGNNLSDLSRKLPELVFSLVKKLVKSGNPASYWIAYRACRNLVKKEPIKVMDYLEVDEYKYKKRIYRRCDT